MRILLLNDPCLAYLEITCRCQSENLWHPSHQCQIPECQATYSAETETDGAIAVGAVSFRSTTSQANSDYWSRGCFDTSCFVVVTGAAGWWRKRSPSLYITRTAIKNIMSLSLPPPPPVTTTTTMPCISCSTTTTNMHWQQLQQLRIVLFLRHTHLPWQQQHPCISLTLPVTTTSMQQEHLQLQ